MQHRYFMNNPHYVVLEINIYFGHQISSEIPSNYQLIPTTLSNQHYYYTTYKHLKINITYTALDS